MAGDTLAELVWHDDQLWVSYYSSHEGRASIYLARVKVLPTGSAEERSDGVAVADRRGGQQIYGGMYYNRWQECRIEGAPFEQGSCRLMVRAEGWPSGQK